jgi:hypothetical protein
MATEKVEKINLLIIQKLLLDRTNPPRTMTRSNAKDPNVFATVVSLPKAAMNRNSAEAIWLMHTSRRYCLKNLPLRKFIKKDVKPKLKIMLIYLHTF